MEKAPIVDKKHLSFFKKDNTIRFSSTITIENESRGHKTYSFSIACTIYKNYNLESSGSPLPKFYREIVNAAVFFSENDKIMIVKKMLNESIAKQKREIKRYKSGREFLTHLQNNIQNIAHELASSLSVDNIDYMFSKYLLTGDKQDKDCYYVYFKKKLSYTSHQI